MTVDTILLALAERLRRNRESMLSQWNEDFRPATQSAERGIIGKELPDYMAELLDDLCSGLQAAANHASEATALHHMENHWDTRWTQRFELPELLTYVASLRTVVIEQVVEHCEAVSEMAAAGKTIAHKSVHRFFDSFMADAASLFTARHDHAMTERQRQALAQELHDGVCQHLQGTLLLCTVILRKLKEPGLKADGKELLKLIKEGIESVRFVAHGLSPMAVHMQGGLEEGLKELVERTGGTIPCRLECDTESAIEPSVALHLYRIAEEAVAGAVEHPGVESILITVSEAEASVALSIADSGHGSGSDILRLRQIRLYNIRNRARAIGGDCVIESIPGSGTCVTCKIPKTPSGATD